MAEPNRLLRCAGCRMSEPSTGRACAFVCRRAEPGEALLSEGVPPERVLFLRRGYVVLMAAAGARGDTSCVVRGKDALLGLEGVFGTNLPYAVRALSEVLYCERPAAGFADCLGPLASPAGVALGLMLEELARRTGERLAVEGVATRRVSRFITSLDAGPVDGALPVVLSVVASVLGMRPETLSRALKRLRALGALGAGPGVRIQDAALLEAIADGSHPG